MRRAVGRRVFAAALVSVSFGLFASAAAADQKKVLVLYSVRRDTQLATIGDRKLPELLERGLEQKPDFYSEYIDSARFPDPEYKTAFYRYLTLKYSTTRFDVVIAIHRLALDFVASHRDELFADVPIVFLSEIASPPHIPNSAGIVAERDYSRTPQLALELQPDTTRVFVVVGNSIHDKSLEAEARAKLQSLAPRLEFTYLSNLTTEDLESRVTVLPEHSVIYYLLFYQDAAGVNVNPLEYLDRLATIANRPIYSWVDSTMNRGVVGGSLMSIDGEIGVSAALAVRVLRGERADDIPLTAVDLQVNQVDWRQLERWGISDARVPAGTRITFREPGVWDRYRSYILGASVLLLAQTALIAGLIAQRARRRRAEEQAGRSEADLRASYERIRDLCARLISAQEAERARIARELHDDIIQQVALLGINLELLATSGGDADNDDFDHLAREALNRVRHIASGVRALSHRLHPAKLRLTGLVPALASLPGELSRPGIAITFSHENVPAVLPNDLTLCVYRIVQEALQNAVKHSGARQASVHLSGYRDGLVVTIADNGAGFDVDAAWGKGLGLISMAERLEPFGGSLNIRARPGAGTRLDVNVPLSAVQGTETVAV